MKPSIYYGDNLRKYNINSCSEEQFVPSKGWAEMMRKVHEVGSFLCPQRGREMKVISFIEDQKAIDRVIWHPKLIFHAERPLPPHNVQQEFLMAAEESEEYFRN